MRVAILGCGYVGLALAEALVAAGHEVTGVRRSSVGRIAETGATPIRGDITDPATLERVPAVDAVVFAASSGGGDAAAAEAIYVDGVRTAIDAFAARDEAPDRFVYTSSTGVYGDHDGGWVDEDTPIDPRTSKAEVLARAEETATSAAHVGMDPIVARCAGIYGPDRWGIERYLDRPVTAGYRNHIHRDDVAGALRHLVESGADGHDLVLLGDDEPVDRWTFADWLADRLDRNPPEKLTVDERLDRGEVSERTARRLRTAKRIDNGRLRGLGYAFAHPTYRSGYAAAVAD